MESKYYTPTIEDLKVGLECEWLADPANEIYKPIELTANMLSLTLNTTGWNFERLGVPGPITNYRIKYLDAGDIESLGFKFVPNSYSGFFTNGKFKIGFWYDNSGVEISEVAKEPFSGKTLFSGKVKNKSELKTIMKQVGIL